MILPDKLKDCGWFGAGWAVFNGGTEDPDFYPPLNEVSFCMKSYHLISYDMI
jgi:hypothetical protein